MFGEPHEFAMPVFSIHHAANGWLIQAQGQGIHEVWVGRDMDEAVRLVRTLMEQYLKQHEASLSKASEGMALVS